MLTLNGPCSSFILMMRPMWGSSSATRMWQRRVAGSVTSDQSGDVAAVPAYIEQQPTQICRWPKQYEQQGVVSKCCYDRVSLLVLEYRCVQRTLNGRAAETLRLRHQCGNPCRQVFVVETRRGKTLDEEAVLSKHENGVNSGSLAERGGEISDVGHWWVRSCEGRKQHE